MLVIGLDAQILGLDMLTAIWKVSTEDNKSLYNL